MKIPLWLIGLIIILCLGWCVNKRLSKIESNFKHQSNSEAPANSPLSASQKANAFAEVMQKEHAGGKITPATTSTSNTGSGKKNDSTKNETAKAQVPATYSKPRADENGIEDGEYADNAPVIKKNEPKITWVSNPDKKKGEKVEVKKIKKAKEVEVAEMSRQSTYYRTLYVDGKKIDPESKLSKLFIAAYFDKKLSKEEQRVLAGTYAWAMRTSSEQAENILFSKGKLKSCLLSKEDDGYGSLRFNSGTKKPNKETQDQLEAAIKRYHF